MVYPVGRIDRSQYESLCGSSAVERLLNACPEARVVLVRTTGLSPLHNIRKVIPNEAIPVLGTGKTDYRQLKALLQEHYDLF
ncbi:MAG: hypothetical protein J7K75_03825 [Desulfuromonas sp.]|nr:hypothetical protein [Desulfuromonas sp.]